jgi:hypothetical protein
MTPQQFKPDEIKRAQDLVGRIQGISSCKISTDDAGEITEVHVVATADKSPKLVARDVESCLKAEMNMHVDYKKIGVVLFDAASGVADPVPEPASAREQAFPQGRVDTLEVSRLEEFPIEELPTRFVFKCVNLFISQDNVKAEVELVRDSIEAFGSAHNDNPTDAPWKLIAEATLRSISEYLDESTRLCLGDVRKVPLADTTVFVVKVDLVTDRSSKSLAGCSIVSLNENQAVVFATLDAVNRILGKLEFKNSVEYKIK